MSPPEQKWYFPPEIAGSLISENRIQYQSSCLRSLRINLRTVTQTFQVSELGLRAETNPVFIKQALKVKLSGPRLETLKPSG